MNTENKENNKNNFIGNMKASFSGRKFRSGAYATMLSVIVIIIVIVVNLLVSKMSIQFDLSSQSMYTLTKDTKELVKGLEDDITIYYMVQQGNETSEFEKIAKLYDNLSSKVTLVKKDPILYPQFAANYVDDEVSQNSFIVVNNTDNRAKYIAGVDMLVQEINYQTYQTETTGIDVEGRITSAIQYVTNDNLPVMYVVEGHGEADTGNNFTETISKMNIEIKTLATMTQAAIPEDCDILYINSPEKDYSDEEATMIKDYLAAGGKALITLDYKTTELTNFSSILDYYGIQMVEGMVLESDTNQFISGYPMYLIPTMESHEITSKVKGNGIPVFMPVSSGLTISDTLRSSLTVESLLSTSDSAFSKTDMQSTSIEKEAGDIDGPFQIGLVATDTYNNVTSEVVVFSSEHAFTDDTATYGNSTLLTATIGYLAGDMETLSIPTKNYGANYIYSSQLQAIMWGAFTVIGIPAAIFVTGAVICYRRRRK